jgi:hypothetical protein
MLVKIWVSIQLKIKKYTHCSIRTRYDELHVLQKHQNIQFRVSDCSMQCVYIRTFRLPVKTTTHRLSTDAIAETVPIFSTILFNHRIPCPGIYCPKIKIPTAASRSPGIQSIRREPEIVMNPGRNLRRAVPPAPTAGDFVVLRRGEPAPNALALQISGRYNQSPRIPHR